LVTEPNLFTFTSNNLYQNSGAMAIKTLEILRIILVGFAFYYGYSVGFEDTYNPEAQLHVMVPIIIVAVAGLSGFEGLFFSKSTAEAKGFETGSNYQKQSAIALLSYAAIALLVYFLNWGTMAAITILFAFLFFLIFSAVNHTVDAVKRNNYKWANINRPFITLVLVAGFIYPIYHVFS
jgi:hypothetical protein